jgi:hypoxanthine phosphoribosyltransferase
MGSSDSDATFDSGSADLGHPAPGERLFDQRQIAGAVARLGREVSEVYGSREITVVAVLHGALVFVADLIRQLDMPLRLETVVASSYRGDAENPGRLEVRMESLDHLRRRHVLLVDDILDTGRTLARIRGDLAALQPASLRTAVLLDKPSRRLMDIRADFVGFEIPDLFVVGYGLDHDGRSRNLPDIVALGPVPQKGPGP